jgi:arogenate dehydrogenase (NADP+)
MRIGIVGLGLIGGSLGLDLMAQGHEVLGLSRSTETVRVACDRHAVQTASCDPAILANTDLVFLCTPVGMMLPTLTQLRPHLSPTTVLTDVGSVKAFVVEAIAPIWPNFVGGHPMAGTAETGIRAAQAGLFRDRPYVITPTETTPPAALNLVQDVVQSLGARLYTTTPALHDQAVAWISHLPILVSAGLIAACLAEPDAQIQALAQAFASTGFKDTSRVGGGNPELGRMVAQFNRTALLNALDVYQAQVENLKALIKAETWDDLELILAKNQVERPKFLN